MNIFSEIKKRRIALALTQEDLAEMANVSLATIKDMDRGMGNPSMKTLQKVLDVLGLEYKISVKQVL